MSGPDLEKVYDFYGLRIIGGDRGGWRKAQCPLLSHEDNNPSASVNTDEGKWFCHACGPDGHGDAYDIIREREGVTRWSDLQSRTHEIAGEGSGSLPPERERSSLLPGGPRTRPGRRHWSPPWSGV